MIKMKMSLDLTEAEIKEAILEYVKTRKNVQFKTVHLSYYQGDSRDPREYSYFSAKVIE